jgi:hypothetical protein
MTAKIGLLRRHAEKTSTNARNRQINAPKLHEHAEDSDHQTGDCSPLPTVRRRRANFFPPPSLPVSRAAVSTG